MASDNEDTGEVMTQRVPRGMSIGDKIKKLTPSEDNPICECVADFQCPYCVIVELQKIIRDYAEAMSWPV